MSPLDLLCEIKTNIIVGGDADTYIMWLPLYERDDPEKALAEIAAYLRKSLLDLELVAPDTVKVKAR